MKPYSSFAPPARVAAPALSPQSIQQWVAWLLVPPLMMTVVGLGHALYSYALLTGLLPELPLAHLAHALRQAVRRDGELHLLQLTVVLGFVAIFCSCWAFLVLRNQAVLSDHYPGGSRSFYRRLLALVLPATPPGGVTALHGARAGRWLAPLWWLLMLGASGCTAAGLLQLQQPVTVGDWRLGYYWLLAAYGLCLAFFVLTRRLVRHLDALQRAYWQYSDAADGGRMQGARALKGGALKAGAG
jgi:hypothetical protein